MRLKLLIFLLTLTICNGVSGQAGKRIAILQANGHFPGPESRVTDSLTSDMVGKPGVAVIDRASVERILKEQNFQNSDRSSADSAVRIGKLVGAGQIILVEVLDASYSTKQDKQPGTQTTTGSIVLNANARLIDVETAVILAQPASNYQDSKLISTTNTTPAVPYGPNRSPARSTTTGDDPHVVQTNLTNKAYEVVAADLSNKLSRSLGAPAGTASAAVSGAGGSFPLVAGIANGSVYINEGSSSGIKVGDRFQVMRSVSIGLKDPATGKDLMQKKRVCTFVAVNVDDSSSSGSCDGGTPLSGDVAQPIKR
jgi:hypothetical protein